MKNYKNLFEAIIKNYYENGTDEEALDYNYTGYYANFKVDDYNKNFDIFLKLQKISSNSCTERQKKAAVKFILAQYKPEIVEDILKRFNSDYSSIIEFLKNTFKDCFKNVDRFYCTLYRVVKADSIDDVNIERPGNHWLFSKRDLDTCAEWCADCEGKHFYCIKVEVWANEINWKRTVWTNFYDGEGMGEANTTPGFKPDPDKCWVTLEKELDEMIGKYYN